MGCFRFGQLLKVVRWQHVLIWRYKLIEKAPRSARDKTKSSLPIVAKMQVRAHIWPAQQPRYRRGEKP